MFLVVVVALFVCLCVRVWWGGGGGERGTETDRQTNCLTDRQTDGETERDRDRDTHTEHSGANISF